MKSIVTLQLEGGCFAFNFTNTISNRNIPLFHDYLNEYNDFLDWCVHAGLLTTTSVKAFAKAGKQNHRKSIQVFGEVIHMREQIFEFFSPIANGKNPNEENVNGFNQALSATLSHVKVDVSGGKVNVSVLNTDEILRQPLDLIVKNAFDILTTEDLTRIKECPNCGWLFLDSTKNNKRRWCNMQVCGSRDKSHRYYIKKKNSAD